MVNRASTNLQQHRGAIAARAPEAASFGRCQAVWIWICSAAVWQANLLSKHLECTSLTSRCTTPGQTLRPSVRWP